MNANANIVDPVKGKSNLVRPRFSPGLLLRDDDLKVGVDYTRELSRLLFQSLFGCGVVCGLRVSTSMECGKLILTVKKGIALNGMGDPIHVREDVPITVDPSCGKEIPPNILVLLCQTEKCCAPRTTVCGCDEEDSASVCTREQEGFEIRLIEKPEEPEDCACMCPEVMIPDQPPNPPERSSDPGCWCANPCECLNPHYAGECECTCWKPECVVLAVVTDVLRDKRYNNREVRRTAEEKGNPWVPNHSVRRFVRPVLMRDPVVYEERTYDLTPCEQPNATRTGNKDTRTRGKTQTAPSQTKT